MAEDRTGELGNYRVALRPTQPTQTAAAALTGCLQCTRLTFTSVRGTTLRYPYDLRDSNPYFRGIHKRRMPKDMISLASHILDTKTGHFDPSRFKDQYETALKALVRRKAKGKKIEPPEEKEKPSSVINLMEALRRSVGGKSRGGSKRTRAKRARRSPRKRKAA